MKKHFNLILVLAISFLFITGDVLAKKNTDNIKRFSLEELEKVEFNSASVSLNSKINPLWEEYQKLSDEEKKLWSAVPEKYYVEYSAPYNPLEKKIFNSMDLNSNDNLPSQFDYRNVNEKNYTSLVKNQGSLGLCWAFATNTSAETNILKKELRESSDPAVFSERQIDYMRATPTNNIPYNTNTAITAISEKYNPYNLNYGLGKGGNFSQAAHYMGIGLGPADATGIWETYDETHKTLSLSDIYNIDNQSYAVTDYIIYPYIQDWNPYNDTEAVKNNKSEWVEMIKNHVYNYGSVYIGTAAPQSSSSGACYIADLVNKRRVINWNYNCNGNESKTSTARGTLAGTHAMSIIGWDDDYEISYCAYKGAANVNGLTGISDSSMTEEECREVSGTYHTIKGTWILQNSWGSKEGSYIDYVYLAYDSGINGVGGIVNTIEKDFDNTYNYLGPIFYTTSTDNSRKQYFYKSKEIESLKRVTIETNTTKDVTYKVYLEYLNSRYYLGNISASLPGTYSLMLENSMILDEDMFSIDVIPTNGASDAAVTNIYAFTKNTTSEPSAKTVVRYNESIVNSVKKYNYYFYTRTANVESGSIVTYKVKDVLGNDYSNSFVNMTQYIVANASDSGLTFSTNPLSINSVYFIETYVDGELLSTDVFDTGIGLEGAGTEENPYLLNSIDDFWYIYTENYSNAIYKLSNDIDISSIEDFEPLGIALNKPASGELYGDNHLIKGLSQNGEFGGLFYKLYEMNIMDLTLQDVNINVSVAGGALASFADYSYVEGLKTEGEINATNPNAYVGGIIGLVDGTDIILSLNKIDVSGGIAGAFVGYLGYWSYLENSFNLGKNYSIDNLDGSISTFFGESLLERNLLLGVVDYSGSTSPNCAMIETLSNDELTISDVYYYSDSTCDYVGTALNDEGLRERDNFSNLDKDYWRVEDGKYPVLNRFPINFVEKLDVVPLNKNMFKGDTFELDLTMNPSDATYPELTYIFSNEIIDKNADGSYTLNNFGPLSIYINTNDASHVKQELHTYAFSNEFETKLQNRKYLTVKDSVELNVLENDLSLDSLELEFGAEDYLGSGDTITYTYNDNVVGEFIALVRGDITGDGVVASDDMLFMKRSILGYDELNEIQTLAGDLTGQGISSANMLLMRRYILGLEEEL